jgi:hypothetical protein
MQSLMKSPDGLLGNVSLGSLSSAFDDAVRGSILAEVEKLPRHAQVFVSALAFEEDGDSDKEEAPAPATDRRLPQD